MELIQWATSPWGKSVPIHIAWSLIWIAVIFGFCFMVVHSLYLIIVKPPKRFAERKAEAAAGVPDRVPRHSLAARLFHWVMAASMITLLITAFLPKVGIQFNWVCVPLDRGVGVDRIDSVSRGAFDVLPGFLVDLAGQDGSDRCEEPHAAVFRQGCAAAEQVCQVSAGEQALSRLGDALPDWR